MDFVVHVDNEYDYRFICEDREKLFVQIKAVFFTKMNKNLPIYDVPDGLNKYATSKKDVQKGIFKLPPDSLRNHDEDVYEPYVPPSKQSTKPTVAGRIGWRVASTSPPGTKLSFTFTFTFTNNLPSPVPSSQLSQTFHPKV